MKGDNFADAVARKRMTAARADLILDEPFFGMLATRLKLVEDASCDTAWTDGTHLGYSPKYVASLSAADLVTLVEHEVLHCSNGHPWRRGGREHVRFNEACDYAINPILQDAGRQVPGNWLLDPQYKGKSAEWIFDRLPVKPPKPRPKQGTGAGGAAGSTGQPDQSDGDDEPTDPQDKRSTPGGPEDRPDSQPAGEDRHSFGDVRDAITEDEGEAAQTEEDWKQATIQAATIAKRMGKLPAGLERFVKMAGRSRVDWRSALRRFAQEKARADYTLTRPNSRYVAAGLYMPSLLSHEVGSFAVAVDTSGSIDNVLLGQVAVELQAIMDEVQPKSIRVLYCDARVHSEETFERGDKVVLKPRGGGGTDFRPVFKWIEGWDEPPVGLVYLTDLWGTFPEKDPGIDTLWLSGDAEPTCSIPFGEFVSAAA